MGGEMDCCKAVLVVKQTPEVVAARLCCATNCSQSGATPPAASLQLSSQPATAPQLSIVAPRTHNGPNLSYATQNLPKGLQFSYLL